MTSSNDKTVLQSWAQKLSGPFSIFLFLGAALVIYGPLLGGGLSDDDFYWCRYAATLGPFGNDHSLGPAALFWRPFLSVTFWCVWKLFGPNPIALRLFNILLVTTTAYAIKAIWLRLSPKPQQDYWPALAAGLVFVAWPTHPENVAWIAGMTDTLAVALSAVALWIYVVYRLRSQFRYLLAACGFLILGMLSKEAVVPLPVACFLLGSILIPWKKHEIQTAIFNGAVLFLLPIAYVFVRGRILGHIVGGYSNKASPGLFFTALTGPKFTVNLAHAYLPFDGFGVWAGFAGLSVWVYALIALGIAFLLRAMPRDRSLSTRVKLALYALTVCFVWIWINAVLYEPFQFTLSMAQVLGPLRMLVFLIILCGVPFAHRWLKGNPVHLAPRSQMGQQMRSYAMQVEARIDPDKHPAVLPLVFAFFIVTIILSGQVTGFFFFDMLLAFFWAVYATRPRKPVGDRNGATKGVYAKIGLTAFLSSLIALVPPLVADLPIDLEGQWFRWSYAATFFSPIAWVAFMCCVVGSKQIRFVFSAGGFACLLLLLRPSWSAWRQAGLVSNKARRLVLGLLPARRIYVLAAPCTVSGAGLFGIGLPLVAEDAAGNPRVEIGSYFQVLNLRSGDRLRIGHIGPVYQIYVRPTDIKRLSPITAEEYDGAGEYFRPMPDTLEAGVTSGFNVELLGFNPKTDRVIFIDSMGAYQVVGPT